MMNYYPGAEDENPLKPHQIALIEAAKGKAEWPEGFDGIRLDATEAMVTRNLPAPPSWSRPYKP